MSKMLTRWLLKVSYNSARIGGHDTHVLRTYVPYIMGQEDEPENISFLVKLVKPTGIWEKSRGSIRRNEMLPTGCHIGKLKFSGDRFGWTVTRVVSINSYHFFLVITPDPNASVSQKEIHDYTRYLHNVKS